MTAQTLPGLDRFAQRRRRAEELQQRYAFAAEVLSFYAKLTGVQQAAYAGALEHFPQPDDVARYAAEHVLPCVMDVSIEHGPPYLLHAIVQRFEEHDFAGAIETWLGGGELGGIDRYLARASSAPVLEALGPAASQACRGTIDERHCPVCGGLPQLSYFAASPEDLVTAHRYLECSRCGAAWAFARMTCAFCGETASAKRKIFDETTAARFPHIRVDGCSTCCRYLLNIDLERDRQAVPAVDEIAALPLDLYAKEHGLRKIIPDLMGF